MSGIDEKRLVETFLELLKINGPTLGERPVADYLKGIFSGLGCEIEEDEAEAAIGGDCGNLLVKMPGKDPKAPGLIFSAHLDTILPTDKLKVVEQDGVFSSDGTTILGADDRAGVAEIVELARALSEEGGSPVPLEFLFTVAEETGLTGAKALKAGWLEGKVGFVLDTSGPVGTAVNRGPYGEKVRVTVRGKAAHAGMAPEAGISAIEIASRAIAGMELGRIDEDTTANIGKISGGEAQNIVPDRTEVIGEARSLVEEKMVRQVKRMEESFEEAAREFGGKVEFKTERDYTGYDFPEDSPLVESARKAAEAVGAPFLLATSCGASDANFLNGLGIPTLNLSAGYLKPHSKEESISREELIKGVKLIYEIVRRAEVDKVIY